VSERNADPLDEASLLEAKTAAASAAQIRAQTQPQFYRRPDGTTATQHQHADGTWEVPECIGCTAELPEGRMQLGRIFCIDCQESQEKRHHAYR
jgi:hypothetical protein